jgi:hypothetical protein
MNTIIIILVLTNAVTSITLLLLWLRSRQQTEALQLELAAMATADNIIPANLNNLVMEHKKRVITIEILNPIELAVAKTVFAKALVGMSPETINKLVYKEARDLVAQKLPDFGVNAEVKIHVV